MHVERTLPRVLLLTTGGTIQASGAGRTGNALADYRIGATPASALLSAVPEIGAIAQLAFEELANIDSAAVDLDLLRVLVSRIQAALASGPIAGIVITHGSDTLEETAYFLNLVLATGQPVVLTAAMRPATGLSADGPLNLLDAVRVAVDPASAGRGVLVVMNGQIHAARDVTKTRARGVETFASPDTGPLGFADPDLIRYYRRPDYCHTTTSHFAGIDLAALPRVDVVATHQEAGAESLRASRRAGAGGIVIADPFLPVLQVAAHDATEQGMAVVLANRGWGGRVRMEEGYHAAGVIPADNLPPRKARILLRLALARTRDRTKLGQFFQNH